MLSSFATTETNEQLKDDEKKGKQPGNGIHQPKKKTARDRDPRTREQTGRDRGQEPVNKQRGIGTPGPVEKCNERVSTFDMQNSCTKRDGIRRRNHPQLLGPERHPSRKCVLRVVSTRTWHSI